MLNKHLLGHLETMGHREDFDQTGPATLPATPSSCCTLPVVIVLPGTDLIS